jgi:UDP:flavonoid glycosyltransferase YjiC (YdhE family)
LEITRVIIESVLLSNVRAIVSRGWSSRLSGGTGKEEDDMLKKHPGTILSVQSVPHDWLFPKIRAVVHHGGAGTTAAGLRAGRPTIIKPFFADQFFWGERVEEMGLGRCIKNMTVENLSAALRVISTDENMLKVANKVGQKIRAVSSLLYAVL